MPAFREEVLNVLLAELLDKRGLLSVPETIVRSITAHGRLPDITVADLRGVRIVIEGRVEGGSGVRASLRKDAAQRVEEGVAPLCLAVLYPRELRDASSLDRLRDSIERSPLRVLVVSEGSYGDWVDTSVDGLAEILRRSYELLVTEDVVISAVNELGEAIEIASIAISGSPAAPGRLRELLGIPPGTKPPSAEEDS